MGLQRATLVFTHLTGSGSRSRSSELVGSAMTFSSGLAGAANSGEPPMSPNLFVTMPSPETAPSTTFDLPVSGGVGGGGGVAVGSVGYQSTPLYLNSPSTNNPNSQVLDSSTGSMGKFVTSLASLSQSQTF